MAQRSQTRGNGSASNEQSHETVGDVSRPFESEGLSREAGLSLEEVELRRKHYGPVKLPGKDTAAVTVALSRHVRRLPARLRRSLTWDRGLEMAQHKTFSVATNVKVYFCDPQSPWQRGTNETQRPKSTSRPGLFELRAEVQPKRRRVRATPYDLRLQLTIVDLLRRTTR